MADTRPPVISFSDYLPETRTLRTIINTTSGTGSVKVTVKDPEGAISATPGNFELVNSSIGLIDTSSFTQITSAHVEFNIIDISASGYINLSALDDAGNSSSEQDGPWAVGCADNDRKINLVDFLPDHLLDTEESEFTGFFEDFLNTMYEKDDCSIGILEKVERLAELNDPDAMDIEYIQYFANKLGYNVDISKGNLGTFQFGKNADDSEPISDDEINKYLRLVVTNLPNWYQIKTTRNAVKIMLFSFGVIGDIVYQWTNDYRNNWSANLDPRANVADSFPSDYYPTPHFTIAVNLKETPPAWIDNVTQITNAINSIRPITTVFDQITGFYASAPAAIQTNFNFRTQYTISIPWSNGTFATSASNNISVVP